MNVETRGRAAAEALRTATLVDVDGGLSRLRRTRRRRDTGRVVAAVSAVVAIAFGTSLVVDRPESAPPVEQPEPGNGPIINAGERDFGVAPTLPRSGPYPLWQAADPGTGAFLFSSDGGSVIVDDSGTVATLSCSAVPCDVGPYPGKVAFGPGEDEVTFAGARQVGERAPLVVTGYDGSVHDQIDLAGAGLPARDVELIVWSPDRRLVAVALDSRDGGSDEVWVLGRDGTGARLVHRERAPTALVEGRHVNEPVFVDLAWSPDGIRLGVLVANELQGEAGARGTPSQPLPRLVSVPVTGGPVTRLHTFEFRNPHSTVPSNFIREWAFAWSPDSTRIAVTHEGGIAEISATDGAVIVQHPGYDEYGPLVWLPE